MVGILALLKERILPKGCNPHVWRYVKCLKFWTLEGKSQYYPLQFVSRPRFRINRSLFTFSNLPEISCNRSVPISFINNKFTSDIRFTRGTLSLKEGCFDIWNRFFRLGYEIVEWGYEIFYLIIYKFIAYCCTSNAAFWQRYRNTCKTAWKVTC